MSPATVPESIVTPQSNPFRVRRIQPGALPFDFGSGDHEESGDREEQLSRLASRIAECRNGRSLIAGPHGTGKTTLLANLSRELRNHFGAVGTVTLSSDHASPENKSPFNGTHKNWIRVRRSMTALQTRKRPLLIIDGAEQLSRLALLRVRMGTGLNVLATSHRRFAGWKLVHQTGVDADVVRRLIDRLLLDQPPEVILRIRDHADETRLESVQDVREFWFSLYDVAAG